MLAQFCVWLSERELLLLRLSFHLLTSTPVSSVILDTYQYWVHRLFHTIPFLYKHVHSLHHRLYVPFAYGSQYNHPFEGGVADAISGILATNLSRMYEREVVLLLTFIAYKSVEDHCGYQWEWHPLRFFSLNDAEFHEIHHQVSRLLTPPAAMPF